MTETSGPSENTFVEMWKVPWTQAAWGRTKVLAGIAGVDSEPPLGVLSDLVEVKITEYAPQFSHLGHRHPHQAEVVIPISGRGVHENERGETHEFGVGHLLYIPANSYHANHNPFEEELRCYILKLPPGGHRDVAVVEVAD
jgi:quercetin dioxygenase-like cupin family protein